MEWLMVVFVLGSRAAPAFADAGYTSEALCKGAGQAVVSQMNSREAVAQRASTKSDAGGSVQAYTAKSWNFECVQVRKR